MGEWPSRRRYGLAVVRGRSMLPTLREGDRLLVRHSEAPVTGALGVVRLPDGTVAVKRLELVDAEGYWFTRDNPREGTDSWTIGRASTRAEVLARVLFRVWPRPGPLPGPPRGGTGGVPGRR